jgi:hypothetical protein
MGRMIAVENDKRWTPLISRSIVLKWTGVQDPGQLRVTQDSAGGHQPLRWVLTTCHLDLAWEGSVAKGWIARSCASDIAYCF